MLTTELLSELRQLSRAEKLRVIQILANELAAEDENALMPGAQYEVWSPFDAAGAAETLMKMLEEDETPSDA